MFARFVKWSSVMNLFYSGQQLFSFTLIWLKLVCSLQGYVNIVVLYSRARIIQVGATLSIKMSENIEFNN